MSFLPETLINGQNLRLRLAGQVEHLSRSVSRAQDYPFVLKGHQANLISPTSFTYGSFQARVPFSLSYKQKLAEYTLYLAMKTRPQGRVLLDVSAVNDS